MFAARWLISCLPLLIEVELASGAHNAIVHAIMQTDLNRQEIEHLKSTQAVLLLFGGPHCGVCQAIKPKLEFLLAQRYPEMARVYVDCAARPDICAQHGVFSLPVVQLYIERRLCLERGRSFSLLELGADIERIHDLWKAPPG